MAHRGHHRIGGRRKQMAEINVVPYIDVMLVLLVIFMVTAPLMTVGTTANLPPSKHAEPLEDLNNPDIKPFFLIVQTGGRLQWQIASETAQDVTLEQLKLKVPVAKAIPNSKIFVYGDEGVPYGEMIAAFDLLRDAGHQELNLALEDPREMK